MDGIKHYNKFNPEATDNIRKIVGQFPSELKRQAKQLRDTAKK